MLSPEEQIAAIATRAMTEAGEEVVNEIRQKISRAYPPSSDPGTPPHLRTGDLALGIHSHVDEFHDNVTLTIVSETPYGLFLRDGTDRMAARDFFGDNDRDLTEQITRRILQTAFTSQASGAPSNAINPSPGNLSNIFGVDII